MKVFSMKMPIKIKTKNYTSKSNQQPILKRAPYICAMTKWKGWYHKTWRL